MPLSFSHYVLNGEDGRHQEKDSSTAIRNRATPLSGVVMFWWEFHSLRAMRAIFILNWKCHICIFPWMFSEISEELVKVEAKSHFWLSGMGNPATLGFKASCWFVEMQTLLSVPASVSPLSWFRASHWNVSPHSNYFIFSPALFFGLELSPRTALSFPRHRCCYPQTDRGKAALLIKSYLIKSWSNVTSPRNLIPISLLTLEPWHFDINQHKCYSRIALMTLWALPM